MYTCFTYYAKCINDQFHICIRSMECEINEWMLLFMNTKRIFPTEVFCLGVYFIVFTRQCVRLVCIYISTHFLTPWSIVPLEKLSGFQLNKKFPAFIRTGKFFTAFIRTRHPSLSLARSNQFITPDPTSWRSILILSSHLCLGHSNGLFHPAFHTKTLFMPLASPFALRAPPI